MGKEVVVILICMMLVLTAVIIIVPENLKVDATPSGGGEEGEIGLDFQYIKNITEALSRVIFNPAVYEQGELKKGRAFGSDGEHYAAE